LDRLRNDFDHYFNEFDSFSLQVGEHQLFFRGKVVYESQDVKESLAFAFFKDGIREIRFFNGLEFREIVDFLNIVRESDSVNRLEDDLVTLLWGKDFSHIAITTVDDFSEGSSVFVPATEEDLLKGLEYNSPGKEGVEENILIEENVKQTISPSPGKAPAQTFQLTPGEMTEINREIQQEQKPEHLYVLIDNLIEILLHLGGEMDAYEHLISYFERTIESLLKQKDVERAMAILMNLRKIKESIAKENKQILAIRRILDTSTNPHFIELIGMAMRGSEEMDPTPILQYLQLLTKEAIDPLCLLLGGIESAKWRKVVTDLVIELSREDIQPLTKFLADRNSIVVRQILSILEKIGHPSTVKYLGNLVTHGDSKVREATLQLLTQFGDKGKDLIQKFLKDPAAEIRAKASLILARMAKNQAVKPLVEIILSEEFYKRNYEEKASFFRALRETGSEEVIPVLKKIASKKMWFNKKAKWDEMRLCATNTLKMMGAMASPVK
jgi:HEAT repeat protein